MAELRTRTPREAAATKLNYGTDSPLRAQDQTRVRSDFADDQPTAAIVTAIDGTNLRADVDAALVAQGATACNNAGARAAIAAVITDALLLTRTAQTTGSGATIPAAR
jgi:hypothetical protein